MSICLINHWQPPKRYHVLERPKLTWSKVAVITVQLNTRVSVPRSFYLARSLGCGFPRHYIRCGWTVGISLIRTFWLQVTDTDSSAHFNSLIIHADDSLPNNINVIVHCVVAWIEQPCSVWWHRIRLLAADANNHNYQLSSWGREQMVRR